MEVISRYIPFLSPHKPKEETPEDEDDTNNYPQTQHPPPPIPPPSQFPSHPSTSFARLRSLSRSAAWNVLPPLPSFEQMQLDVVEFWIQAVILETDPEQSTLYQRNIEHAIHALPSKSSPSERLEARLTLAASARELVTWQLGQVGSTKEGSVSTYNFGPDEWKRLQDEWNEMREKLVRAVPTRQDDDLLQGDFRAVGRLLHYQHILSKFCESLQEDNPSSVQESIEMLENEWNGGDFRLDEDEEEHSLAPEQTMVPSQIRNILQPLKKHRPSIAEGLQRYRDLLWGDESNEFSHAHLQHAMHSLIVRWSESILDIPTLFHLRYAGVAPYTVQDPENDDVSSFGDEEEAKKRREQENGLFNNRFEDPVAAMANNVADPEVVAQVESDEPAVDPVLDDEPKHLSEDVGEAAKQAAENIDDMKDSELNIDEEDYPETQPPMQTQKVSIQQQRFVASKRVLLSTGHSASPEAYTQSQEPETEYPDHDIQNQTPTEERSIKRSNKSNRITEPRIVDENVPVNRERKRDSLMDSSDDDTKGQGRKKQKRNKFTHDEEEAIREGVKKFGVGNWKHIKANDRRLNARTSVQIKDKYRTMLQKGEI